MVHAQRILSGKVFSNQSQWLKGFSCIAISLVLSASLLSMASCGASGNKANEAQKDTLIQLNTPGIVSAAELQHYKSACQSWYDTVLKSRGFNGGMIVAKKGNIVFEAYNGTAHLGKADSITSSTTFHIASVSKTFTAMAILKLAQDHKLNIDDELVKYFPSFNYPGVTIRTLLNHRSGLPNYTHFMEKMNWDKKQLVSNQDIFNLLVTRKATLQGISLSNTRFAYCNTNYALLALVIEKVTGLKYAAYLQHTFFTPLQMNNTFVFDSSRLTTANTSYDWRGTEIPFAFLDMVYGDKNIYTTPQDLLIWDKALSSGKLFTEATLAEAFMPYSNERPGIKNYGLGWRMNVYPNGKKMIYHNGWWHGNNAAFIRLVQDSATIIVVGNRFNRGIYHARDLAPLFGDYGGAMEEEEEASGTKPLAVKSADSLSTRPKRVAAKKAAVTKISTKKIIAQKKSAPVKTLPKKKHR